MKKIWQMLLKLKQYMTELVEQDEFFLRAKRTEVPASLTAIPFYLKMGYQFKNGSREPDGELLVRMEKYH